MQQEEITTCNHKKRIIMDVRVGSKNSDHFKYLIRCDMCKLETWVGERTAQQIEEIPERPFRFFENSSNKVGEKWKVI